MSEERPEGPKTCSCKDGEVSILDGTAIEARISTISSPVLCNVGDPAAEDDSDVGSEVVLGTVIAFESIRSAIDDLPNCTPYRALNLASHPGQNTISSICISWAIRRACRINAGPEMTFLNGVEVDEDDDDDGVVAEVFSVLVFPSRNRRCGR